MQNEIMNRIQASIKVKDDILNDSKMITDIQKVCDTITACICNGGTVYLAGNGGSASDAQHIAAELVGRFYKERKGLSAEALSTNTSILTAIGNDYGYDAIFARQIEARGKKGDVFIGFSTSGNSPNIIKAIEECKKTGIIVIGMTGVSGGSMNELCDICLKMPSKDTPRIQESHIMIGHILCEFVEAACSN